MSWQREETRILRRWDRRGYDLEPEDLNSSLSSSLCGLLLSELQLLYPQNGSKR